MSLTILKQKMLALYDTFINDTLDAFRIAEVKKSALGTETYKQNRKGADRCIVGVLRT